MGSIFEWITIPKAADALGVSVRQVYKYIAKGQLTTLKEGKTVSVNRKDVRALIECKKLGIPRAVNAMSVARIDAEVQILKKQVETLMRILDIRYEPLELDRDDLVNLHDMALHNLKIPWSPHEEIMWCDVFVRLRVEDLEKIAEKEGYENPWRPFLALSRVMYNHPHDSGNKTILAAGQSNVEKIGFAAAQKLEGLEAKDINHLLKKDSVLVGRMDRKLERQQKSDPEKA